MLPIRWSTARFSLIVGALGAALIAGSSPEARAADPCDCRAPEPLEWIVSEPLSEGSLRQQFNDILLRGVQRHLAQVKETRAPAASLASTLRTLAARPNPGTLMMTLNFDGYAELTRDASGRDLLAALGLEVVNTRLISLPFHVFVPDPGQRRKPADRGRLRLAYYTPYELPVAPLVASVGSMLPAGAKIHDAQRWHNPETLAQELLEQDGSFDIVAILDEEPSVHVARFLQEYRRRETCNRLERSAPLGGSAEVCAQLMLRECRSEKLRGMERDQLRKCAEEKKEDISPLLFPISLAENTPVPPNQLPPPASALMTVLVDYEGQEFYGFRTSCDRPGAIAVIRDELQRPSPARAAYPLVLTNLRSRRDVCCAKKLREVLGDTYVAMMPLVEEDRGAPNATGCAPARSYLLNAVLLGGDDALRTLVLYGRLRLAGENDRARVLLESRNLDLQAPPEKLVQRLGGAGDDNVRRQFSGSPVTAYENALKEICRAGSDRAGRAKALARARRELFACILANHEPKSVQSGRGLWSIAQYDPYWQLTRIALMERLDIDPGPRCP